MQIPRKLVLAGALLGLIPIALGVVGLVTNSWVDIKVTGNNSPFIGYGLFSCNSTLCSSKPGFRTAQGLEIAGVATILAGVVVAVLLDIVTKNRFIHLLSQILLFAGPTLIVIGLLLYAKYLFEDLSKLPRDQAVTLDLGYSIILMIVASLLGFLTAIYFAFAAGFGRYHVGKVIDRQPSLPSVIVQQDSDYF
jgi:hypothetical protein